MRWIVFVAACWLVGCAPRASDAPAIEARIVWAGPGFEASVYATVTATNDDDRLLGVSTEGAEAVSLHETRHDGEFATMSPVDELSIPGRETVVLEAGGAHGMIHGVPDDWRLGDRVPVTFHFAHRGVLTVDAVIERPGDDSVAPRHH